MGGGVFNPLGAFDTTIPGIPIEDFGLPQFDDPGTALLEDLAKARVQELLQPFENPALKSLIDDITSRINELRGPVFSAEDENLLRTASLDRIGRLEDQARQRALEELGTFGRAPTSGLNLQVLRDISESFNQQRTGAEASFGQYAIGERQRRLDQALGLSGQLAEIPRTLSADEATRRREALATAGLLSELPERRLQLALATLGQQPPPPSLFANLAQLVSLGQGQQRIDLLNQQFLTDQDRFRQQNLFSFIGSLASLIPSLVSGGRSA